MAQNGGKRPGAGRKPGVPNKLTVEIREKIATALEPLLTELPTILKKLTNRQKMDYLLAFLPYICAKPEPETISPEEHAETAPQFWIEPVSQEDRTAA